MPELSLTTLSNFGELSQREQAIAKSAAQEGWEGAMKLAVEALPDTIKRLDADSVKRTAPELFKSILKLGWDLAIKNRAPERAGVSRPAGEPPFARVVYEIPLPKDADVRFDAPDPAMFTGKAASLPPVVRLELPPEGVTLNLNEGKKPDMMIEHSPDGRQTRIRR